MIGVAQLLPGCYHIPLARLPDARGAFVKTYAASAMAALGLSFDFREEYYSVSAKNVVRGMHFQAPPHAHDKLVYCPAGAALDVLLDLRRGDRYGQVRSIELSAAEPALLFIARGVAHGFKSLQDETVMVYKTSSEYAPSHDQGIRWDSIGFDWACHQPLLSRRDGLHPALAGFQSPF